MNCFVHSVPAVGVCAACQRGACKQCVALEKPRLLCAACKESRRVLGFEYKSASTIGGWPLVHVCFGADAATLRPKVARGVIAIGNMAVGGFAMGGLAAGLVSLGGLSIGILGAIGGAALGLGFSLGGLAVGSVALGGAAVGFSCALGGAAFGESVIDGRQCQEAAREFFAQWLGERSLPPSCR